MASLPLPYPNFTDDLELDFVLLEKYFKHHLIESEETRYLYLCMTLAKVKVNASVRKLLVKEPETLPYSTLKNEILSGFRPKSFQEVRHLLLREKLGTSKPSEFYDRLENIADLGGEYQGIEITIDEVRECWLEGLPAGWRAIIRSLGTWEQKPKIADDIQDSEKEHAASAAILTDHPRAANLSAQVPAASSGQVHNRDATLDQIKHPDSANSDKFQDKNTLNADGRCYYHFHYKTDAHKCIKGCVDSHLSKQKPGASKPISHAMIPSVSLAGLRSGPDNRLYVYDPITKFTFLVVTGTDVSVIPRSLLSGHTQKKATDFKLTDIMNSEMATYGTIELTVNLGLSRDRKWRFRVADVEKPILGADFIYEYGLIVSCGPKGKLQEPRGRKNK